MPTAADIRQQFLDFFVRKAGHTAVPSAPVVPHDDPTLLFTNAGMNQFKDVFLGVDSGGGKREYTRAVDTQKCIRAGGKHNDLDDVGKDTYHHTFFEMLGNWSFGDYFKADAIDWAWELLTSQEWWGIDPERLHATYFEGDPELGLEPDLEAKRLWEKHLPADRIHPGNKKDNFWEMGDTGPCGPCSEIHYDRSEDLSSGGGGALVNADGQDTVVEIWNLVFIQFNRLTSGGLEPLPAKHVDTGMGFERVVRVLQGKDSNYDTDVFAPIFEAIQDVTGARAYQPGGDDKALTDPINVAYRVIADHIRTLTFALADGAHCTNDGRGYVLRRILRRAVRYGRQTLGVQEPFFYKLVPAVVENFKGPFPELVKHADAVSDEIRDEEESFGKTLDRGIQLFEQAAEQSVEKHEVLGKFRNPRFVPALDAVTERRIAAAAKFWLENRPNDHQPTIEIASTDTDEIRFAKRSVLLARSTYRRNGGMPTLDEQLQAQNHKVDLSGEDAFQLHDTYGFPLDLTQLMAEERGMSVDVAGFNRRMDEARAKSRAGGDDDDGRATLTELVAKGLDAGWFIETNFTGYDATEAPFQDNHLHLFKKDGPTYVSATAAAAGDEVAVVLQMTPFYAEAGGQVGDTGAIVVQQSPSATGGQVVRIKVEDTIKVGGVHLHLGRLTAGQLEVGDGAVKAALAVDAERRGLIQNNHTTTHVMNRALRDHVNPEADQKGSLVDDEKLRFDFSQASALTDEQVAAVEKQVNDDVAADLPVYARVVPQQDALRIKGLRAVFGEKYPPRVRVVSIGRPVDDLIADPENDSWADLSIEFCGGTHLSKTGDAEGFCIVSQEAVSKGVRRVTALTGPAAHRATAQAEQLLARLDFLTDAPEDQLAEQIDEVSKSIDAATLPLLQRHQMRTQLGELNQRLKAYQKARGNQAEKGVVEAAQSIAAEQGGSVIVAEVPGADGKTLRTALDVVRKKHADAAIFLGAATDGKVAMLASVPEALVKSGFKAGDWIKHVAPIVGGGGGGRPDMAQAGGKDPAQLPDALAAAHDFAQGKV
jgi:alanyl-tRNA synthetase